MWARGHRDSGIQKVSLPTHVLAAVAEKADWYHQMAALQGHENLYYIGEMFFSAGVMSSVDGVDNFMPRFFTPQIETN